MSGAAAAAAAAAAGNPLILQSRSAADAPPLKFPAFDIPRPVPLTSGDRELVERSRFLSETYKYSGYYVVPDPSRTKLLQQHRLVSSSFAHDGAGAGASQQIYTQTFERYSDRYRKILGKKSFHSEIAVPNTHLFPPELLNDKNGRLFRGAATTTFTSKVQFLSTKTLLSEVTRLVTARVPVVDDPHGDVDMDGTGTTAAPKGDDVGEEDEEDGMQEDGEEEDDQEDGDDYGENHRDDDEDGADAFGDDGDEGDTM